MLFPTPCLNRKTTVLSCRLHRVMPLKSDEIVKIAGDFGPKSSSSIHYTIRILPIITNIQNIKNLQSKISCNCENINKLFYQKNDFSNDFLQSQTILLPYKSCVTEKRTYIKTIFMGSMPSLLLVFLLLH